MDQARLKAHRDELERIARRHGVTQMRLFGSVARGQASEESDLDLLVDFEPGRDLLDVAGLKLELEALLRCRVHVVEEAALSPYLRAQVLAEAQAL